eukprot:767083-Hanusia_phi.AAC.14
MSVDEDLARHASSCLPPGDHVHQRRLAGSRRPHERRQAARREHRIHLVDQPLLNLLRQPCPRRRCHVNGVGEVLEDDSDSRRLRGDAGEQLESSLRVQLGFSSFSTLFLGFHHHRPFVVEAAQVQRAGVEELTEEDEEGKVQEAQADPTSLLQDGERLQVHVSKPLRGGPGLGKELVVAVVRSGGGELVDGEDAEDPRGRDDPEDPDEVAGDVAGCDDVAREAHGQGGEGDSEALSARRRARVGGDGLKDRGEGQGDQKHREEEGGKRRALQAHEEEAHQRHDQHLQHLQRKLRQRLGEHVDPRGVEARVPMLVEDGALGHGSLDDVHVAHGHEGSQEEEHRDLERIPAGLPEDGADDD